MSCKNKCHLKASRHNDEYLLGYCDGMKQGRADERERIIRELEKIKASAVDKVKLPKFIKKDIKELTDLCFDEAIEVVMMSKKEY